MKYDLIFYIAKKTGYCEKRVRALLKSMGAEPNRIVSATSPSALGDEAVHSLRLCPLAVIVGGLSSPDDDNLATVLSRVFSNSALTLENMRKITAPSGSEGYIVRCKSQVLLALPDEPRDIDGILSPDLLAYIKEKTAQKAE